MVARIRPLLDKELDKDTIVRAESNQVWIPNPKKPAEEFSFTFNSVYDMGTTQEELFTNEGAPTCDASHTYDRSTSTDKQ